jgi:hypothetical protein
VCDRNAVDDSPHIEPESSSTNRAQVKRLRAHDRLKFISNAWLFYESRAIENIGRGERI